MTLIERLLNVFKITKRDNEFTFSEIEKLPEGAGELVKYRRLAKANIFHKTVKQAITIRTNNMGEIIVPFENGKTHLIRDDFKYNGKLMKTKASNANKGTGLDSKEFKITSTNGGTLKSNLLYIEDKDIYRLAVIIKGSISLDGVYIAIFDGDDMDTFDYVNNPVNYL